MAETILRTEKDRADLIGMLQELDLTKPWKVTVERPKKRRSLSQNGLYWMWIDIAAKDIGYDKEDLHEALMEACDAPMRSYTDLNGNVRRRRTTSGATSEQMADYMDRVYRKLAGVGIILPIPEQQHTA